MKRMKKKISTLVLMFCFGGKNTLVRRYVVETGDKSKYLLNPDDLQDWVTVRGIRLSCMIAQWTNGVIAI